MAEDIAFLPKRDVLNLDEVDRLVSAFVTLGVRRLRLTGGEPLARKNIESLVRGLSRHLRSGAVDEITLTTNGSLLSRYAGDLMEAGVRRINVSLDTLDPNAFRAITRRGDLSRVLDGINAALAVGMRIKINAVAMRGVNEHHLESLMLFAHGLGMDLTLIETMPVGAVTGHRSNLYLPLSIVRDRLSRRFTLKDIKDHTAGPSRYVLVEETGGRLGFVTPITHGFCADCNRVRLTCAGQLVLCLGQDLFIDLKTPLRASEGDDLLHRVIRQAVASKPRGHSFLFEHLERPLIVHPMSLTGG